MIVARHCVYDSLNTSMFWIASMFSSSCWPGLNLLAEETRHWAELFCRICDVINLLPQPLNHQSQNPPLYFTVGYQVFCCWCCCMKLNFVNKCGNGALDQAFWFHLTTMPNVSCSSTDAWWGWVQFANFFQKEFVLYKHFCSFLWTVPIILVVTAFNYPLYLQTWFGGKTMYDI